MGEPKFKIGDILRYGDGPTALMKVESISPNHGGAGIFRYYGQQCMCGAVGAYEKDCVLANETDIDTWYEIQDRYEHTGYS